MLDPYWLVGFTTGEGCFFVDIFPSKTYKAGYQVKLKFQLTQHKRDEQLMKSLIEYFDCGNLYKDRECRYEHWKREGSIKLCKAS